MELNIANLNRGISQGGVRSKLTNRKATVDLTDNNMMGKGPSLKNISSSKNITPSNANLRYSNKSDSGMAGMIDSR